MNHCKNFDEEKDLCVVVDSPCTKSEGNQSGCAEFSFNPSVEDDFEEALHEQMGDSILKNIADGKLKDVLNDIEQYKRNWDDDLDVLAFKAFFAEEMNDHRTALKWFRRLVDLRGEELDYYSLGRLLIETGNIEDALKWIGLGLAYHHDSALLWYVQATIMATGDYPSIAEEYFLEAIACLDYAENDDPYDLGFLIHYEFSNYFFERGKYRESCEQLEKAFSYLIDVNAESDDEIGENVLDILSGLRRCVEAAPELHDYYFCVLDKAARVIPDGCVTPYLVLLSTEKVRTK